MDLSFLVRRFTKQGNGADNAIRATGLESLAVAQVEADNVEVARAGRRFAGGNQIIANGIAPVSAIPTTTATVALYNAEADGGKAYCVDRINFWLGSGTAAAGATLMVAISPSKIATVPTTNATGYASASCSGSANQTKSRWATAVTFPSSPIAPAWVAVISTFQLAAANVGQGDGFSEQKGALIIPAGYALGFAILSGAGTTPLYGISAQWTEIELDLE